MTPRSISWELPHNIPFSAKQRMIEDFLAQWDEPSRRCHCAVADKLEDELTESVDQFFGRYPKLKNHIGYVRCQVLSSAAFSKMNLARS